jgi:hypothetical protein
MYALPGGSHMPEKESKTWSSIDRTHGAARLAVLCTSVCFTFWGCAPLMSTPPAAPVAADRSHELGFSVAGGMFPNAAVGYRHRFKGTPMREDGPGRIEVGVHAFVPGVGAYLRRYFVSNERVNFGAEIGGGYWYGEVALPISIAVNDRVSLTAKPAGGMWGARSPVGFSVERENGRIDVEAGANLLWEAETGGQSPYVGVGISRTW